MEEEEVVEFVSEYTDDDDEDIVLPNESTRHQSRRLSKKGSTSGDDGKRKSSFDRKPAKKTKRKLKTVAHLSVGLKNKTKKTTDKKKMTKRKSRDVWELGNVTGNESTSLEDVGEDVANATQEVDREIRINQNKPRVNQNWKTARHAVDWAVNPKRRSGELKPLKQPVKKKTRTKPSSGGGGGGAGKKKRNHDDVNVLKLGIHGGDGALVSPVDDDDTESMGTDCEQPHERGNEKHDDYKNEIPEEMDEWSDDPHRVESSYSDDFTDDDASVASSLNISRDHRNNENTYQPARTSANTRYYLQQSRKRQTDGVNDSNEGAKQAQEDGRAAEGFYSAEMRRQRVLGMYGTGYAVRWAAARG